MADFPQILLVISPHRVVRSIYDTSCMISKFAAHLKLPDRMIRNCSRASQVLHMIVMRSGVL